MEKRRVVITGLGTVNPLGNTATDSWAAAKAGRCGIGPITQFDTTDFKCKLAGEVKNFDPETVVDKKEARKMARFTLLALAAAAEAIADSGLNTEAEAKNIGVVLSSGIGGLPTIEEQHTRGEEKGMEKVSPYFVPMSIANMAAAQVAIRFGLKGMCTCPVTACAGGTNAVGDAFHRIRDGYETAMVCGGAESCISPLGIGGFTSMKALSTATDPDAASLPFDARRGGFVMGEGSGVLVLEELEHARARGAHIYAEVVGYGANCDAYHFTAPAPGGTGAIDCMKLTLADAGIAPEQVDHINAHGTGTHMNDACETAAIHAVFGEHAKQLTVVSTKSMTGHLLGGAGGIEAVFTALALRDQFAPPTIHYEQPDPECDLDYVPNAGRAQTMTYALSNSLGFGGHNACIALRRWEGWAMAEPRTVRENANALNSEQIAALLPHRYPFALVDRILDYEPGQWAIGRKCVSRNEEFFCGHFPGQPVMPGVLILEALAQTGAVAALSVPENKGKLALFGGIKNARFRKQVTPGDVLTLHCELVEQRGPVGIGKASAYVDGKCAATAELTFVLTEANTEA